MVCGELNENVHTIKKTGTLLVAAKEVGFEVHTEQNEVYMFMLHEHK